MSAYSSNNEAELQWDFEKTGQFRKCRKAHQDDWKMKGVFEMSLKETFSKCPP